MNKIGAFLTGLVAGYGKQVSRAWQDVIAAAIAVARAIH